MQSSAINRTEFVKAGACIDSSDNRFLRCALEPDDCPVEDYFRGPWQLESSRTPLPQQALECLAPDSVKGVAMGRCIGDGSTHGFCASTAALCPMDSSFLPHHKTCSVLVAKLYPGHYDDDENEVASWGYSSYGRCSGNTAGICAWSSSDCPAGTVFARFYDGSCPCDRVRTGACLSTENFSERFCAVAAETCDTQHTAYRFVPVHELESLYGISCFLCDSLPPSSELDRYISWPAEEPPTSPPSTQARTITPSSSGGGGSTGQVTGAGGAMDEATIIVIAVVTPLFLVMVAVYLAYRGEETRTETIPSSSVVENQTSTEANQSQQLPTSSMTNEGDLDDVESLKDENKLH